jgi:hypothetical protein
MRNSPERRIYENSPTAPTPNDIKQGLRLLLDTCGKKDVIRGSSLTGEPEEVNLGKLNAGIGSRLPDGTHSQFISFRSSLDEDGEGCIGMDVYARTIFPGVQERKSYRRLHALEVHRDTQGDLIAVDHDDPNGRENLSKQKLRTIGKIIFDTWEAALEKEKSTKP